VSLRALLRSIEPVLDPEPYVFAVVDDPPADLRPFALAREDEGTTLVLTRREAAQRGFEPQFVARRITLRVHSSLAAVGLTAAVSGALAERGISCNVIAGAHHDHLFVPADRGEDALRTLRELSAATDPASAAPRLEVRPPSERDFDRWRELYRGYADFYGVEQPDTAARTVWRWSRTRRTRSARWSSPTRRGTSPDSRTTAPSPGR